MRIPDVYPLEGRRLLAILYAPAFWLGFIGAALVLQPVVGPIVLPALLVTAIGVSSLAERLLPYESVWNRSHGDTLRDIAHALVNEGSKVVAVLAIPVAAGLLPWRSLWPDSLPLALQLLLAILMADVGITLVHFASHRVRWLWRFHAVHHSVERLYGFNGLLKHPLHQALETLAGTLPLLLIGMPMDIGWLLGFAVSIQLLLQHSNVDMAIGPLAGMWAVAPVHRLHHVGSAIAGDVNFGLFTCLVDHLLGTARRDGPRVGAGMIGIEARPDFPRGYLEQLLEPFHADDR